MVELLFNGLVNVITVFHSVKNNSIRTRSLYSNVRQKRNLELEIPVNETPLEQGRSSIRQF